MHASQPWWEEMKILVGDAAAATNCLFFPKLWASQVHFCALSHPESSSMVTNCHPICCIPSQVPSHSWWLIPQVLSDLHVSWHFSTCSSSPCRIYDSFALPNLYQMSPYVKGQLWWGVMLEICLNEPDRVENWRGILQQQQEIMQILQNQAFFFEKGRQDILPHCNDISDSEAQVTLQ